MHIYTSVLGSRVHGPPPGHGPGMSWDLGIGCPTEWNMHVIHAYAPICMNIRTCVPTSTYACMAYAYRHMHAWHACTYTCMHGMHAYMHASSHVHLHPTSHRGGGHESRMTMSGALQRRILWAPPRSTPHPTGGAASPGGPLPWGGGGGGPLGARTYMCIYVYMTQCIYVYIHI